MKIPFVDLQAQYASIKNEIDSAIETVIRETSFIGGPHVAAFEKAFAECCGASFAIGVSNGTDALRLALLGCGVGPSDEVITVPNTFIATTEAISMVGAKVRFVDVEPKNFTLDPRLLEGAVTEKTRAILPVHLYGRPADMDPILECAGKRGLKVIGDAAQAHGATYKGRKIGTLGDAVCFSFFPGKNLGAYGDAGCVVTNDPEIAKRVAMLKDHGRLAKYTHQIEGFNCRLDALQAAILSVKLKHLEDWTEKRRSHASRYRELLESVRGLGLPDMEEDVRSVFHLYVVRTPHRSDLQTYLQNQGISTGIHYPIPLHRQPAYSPLNLPEGTFPVAEAQSQNILSLPLFPEMTAEQMDYVVDHVRKGLNEASRDR